jgi:hypothetical protein
MVMSFLLIAISLTLIVLTIQTVSGKTQGYLGSSSRFFPIVTLAFLVALSIGFVARGLVGRLPEAPALSRRETLRSGILCLASLALYYVWSWTGFLVAATAFIAGLLVFFGIRNPLAAAILLASPLVLQQIFSRFLGVPL